MRMCFWKVLFFVLLTFSGISIEARAEERINTGVVIQDARLYIAADRESACIGNIAEGTRVEIISVLSEFVIIKHGDIYAYLPYFDIQADSDYEKQLGHQKPYLSQYPILETEGRLYENSVDIMMEFYMKIPEKIRTVFEDQGFRIKMTEWDVTEEAYAPYGGYHGIGKVKAVLDYERKMLYINDEWPEEIVHEMGHFINDYLGMYSLQPENKEIYTTESSKISYYAEENDREFFAETFKLYVLEPQLLQKISHQSYIMVDEAVNFGLSTVSILLISEEF